MVVDKGDLDIKLVEPTVTFGANLDWGEASWRVTWQMTSIRERVN